MGCTVHRPTVIILEPGERKRKFSKHSSLDLSLPEEVYIPIEGNKNLDITQLYTVSTQIAKGKFGSVFLAKSMMTGKAVAVKIQGRENEYAIMSELSIITRLDHPNIIKPIEFFQDSKFYYIIFEYLAEGELISQQDQTFDEDYTKQVIYKLLLALNHMNSMRVVHRDLKPENILVDEAGDISIIDFGLSKYFTPGHPLKDVVGTPLYMAPEVTSGEYSSNCDLWSVGVIMYRMLFNKLPNLGSGKEEILKTLRTGRFELEKADKSLAISQESQNLLNRLLEKNPSKRIKLLEALEHKWFGLEKEAESSADCIAERTKIGSRPGDLQFVILKTAALALDMQDFGPVKDLMRKLDKDKVGVVRIQVAGICELMKYSEFAVCALKSKILEKGVPVLFEWCLKDGKFCVEALRKTVMRKGSYLSSALFTKQFESVEELRRFLS